MSTAPTLGQAASGDPIQALLDELVTAHGLPTTSVDRARQAAGSDVRVDKILVKLGLLEERTLVKGWSTVLGLAEANASEFPRAAVLPELLNSRFLKMSEVLPLSTDGVVLRVAVADPLDAYALAALRSRTGLSVEHLLAPASSIREALDRIYPTDKSDTDVVARADVVASDLARLKDLASDAPAVLLVNSIIEHAVELGASDVHLSMARNGPRLRFRVDGVLRDEQAPSTTEYEAIISRVKVLAELDITERRLPQDGRIRFGVSGREIDLRIATMPHLEGEGAVLRILDRSAINLDLPSLGFSSQAQAELLTQLREPHGIFLVTGPTGSGKTTTLYAALRLMVRAERNFISVEDPVEYHLDGVAQVQVQRKVGLTFPSALRAILRQDPDVIMIGEVRDQETALIANQAALTGHFVLATLHTNSAAASLPRLIDMGLEPYLLASTIRGALSQRLVRRLCRSCARPFPRGDTVALDQLRRLAELACLPVAFDEVRVPVGCPNCNRTGYKGRIAITEIISATDAVRQAVLRRADASEIEAICKKSGSGSLLRSGAEKVFEGLSGLAEVLQATGGGSLQ